MQAIESRIIKTEAVDLGKLSPFQGGAKNMTEEAFNKLRKTILNDGFAFTLHVWETAGKVFIIDGHQRFEVLKSLDKQGHEIPKINCSFLDLKDTKEAKRLVLLSMSQFGKIQKEGFFEFLGDDVLDMDLDDFDFPDLPADFFDVEMTDEEKEAEREREDAVPEIPEDQNPYGVVRGQVWALGNNRLMCGDSTSGEDFKKLMDGKKADLWLTDPPYNVNYEGGTGLKIENDNMEDADFRSFLTKVNKTAFDHLKAGGSFYIWHADSEGYNFRGAALDAGLRTRQCLIWLKSSLVLGRQDYHWKHEPCLYGWKEGAGHGWYTDRKQTTVFEFDKPSRNDVHPTMKPVDLFEYQIKNSSQKGEIVLDSFLGSGTTIIASEKAGRVGYGMELDPHYCCVIIRRWEEYSGKDAKLLG